MSRSAAETTTAVKKKKRPRSNVVGAKASSSFGTDLKKEETSSSNQDMMGLHQFLPVPRAQKTSGKAKNSLPLVKASSTTTTTTAKNQTKPNARLSSLLLGRSTAKSTSSRNNNQHKHTTKRKRSSFLDQVPEKYSKAKLSTKDPFLRLNKENYQQRTNFQDDDDGDDDNIPLSALLESSSKKARSSRSTVNKQKTTSSKAKKSRTNTSTSTKVHSFFQPRTQPTKPNNNTSNDNASNGTTSATSSKKQTKKSKSSQRRKELSTNSQCRRQNSEPTPPAPAAATSTTVAPVQSFQNTEKSSSVVTKDHQQGQQQVALLQGIQAHFGFQKASDLLSNSEENKSDDSDNMMEREERANVVSSSEDPDTTTTTNDQDSTIQEASIDKTTTTVHQRKKYRSLEEGEDQHLDFDSSQETIVKSKSIVHQLMDRSVFGTTRGKLPTHQGPRISQGTQLHYKLPTSKVASWINLGGRQNNNAATNAATYRIDGMAWDPLGVLLAVAQTCHVTHQSWIDVYDWDTVRAADQRGRNARQQASNNSNAPNHKIRLDVPPLLQFRIPEPSSSRRRQQQQRSSRSSSSSSNHWMKWNPHNPDQLAVASACGTELYILDIAQVEEALAAAPPDRILKPPRHSFWVFRHPDESSNNIQQETQFSSCLFVARDHILIACGAVVNCWRYYPRQDPTSIAPKCKWAHCFRLGGVSALRKATISSMEAIGAEHALIGSSHGHLALIQWKRTVTAAAASSFSILSSSVKRSAPTVLCQWLSHSPLGQQQRPQIPLETDKEPTLMGIRQLQVEYHANHWDDSQREQGSSSQHSPGSSFEQLCGRFKVQWVTRCGWVLSTMLVASPSSPSSRWEDYKVRREKPRIVFQSARVQTRLASGGRVNFPLPEWSLPTEPVATHGGASFLCWQKVASVTKILPHHDQRVLDNLPSIVRTPKEDCHLYLQTTSSPHNTMHSLPLPVRRGRPKCIVVDPVNQEWVVVATSQAQLYVVHLRCAA